MAQLKFRLSAHVSSDNPSAIKPVLEQIIADKGTVRQTDQGFEVEAELEPLQRPSAACSKKPSLRPHSLQYVILPLFSSRELPSLVSRSQYCSICLLYTS